MEYLHETSEAHFIPLFDDANSESGMGFVIRKTAQQVFEKTSVSGSDHLNDSMEDFLGQPPSRQVSDDGIEVDDKTEENQEVGEGDEELEEGRNCSFLEYLHPMEPFVTVHDLIYHILLCFCSFPPGQSGEKQADEQEGTYMRLKC